MNWDALSLKYGIASWRRVMLSDLPYLESMVNKGSHEIFGPFDIARMIGTNFISLCQLNFNDEVSSFLSLSNRPNIGCVPSEHWIEWFRHYYELKDVTETNTLFIHLILFNCTEYLAYFSLLLETVYAQLPEIAFIILIKPPGTVDICKELCLPFLTLGVKGEPYDSKTGSPAILFHAKVFIIATVHLRVAQEGDNDELRTSLGNKLNHLDSFYGEYCLAELFKYPGQDRVSLVPTNEANGFVTINTNLNYGHMEKLFDLYHFPNLVILEESSIIDQEAVDHESELSDEESKVLDNPNDQLDIINTHDQRQNRYSQSLNRNGTNPDVFQRERSVHRSDTIRPKKNYYSIGNVDRKPKIPQCEKIFNKRLESIPHFFWKFQDKELKIKGNGMYMQSSIIMSSLMNPSFEKKYKKTSFVIELMLMNDDAENKSIWDYLSSCFYHFRKFDYCVVVIPTIAAPTQFKKFFVKVPLKPNVYFPMDLYLIHRCSMNGVFKCEIATEKHMNNLNKLIYNHPFKTIISNNVSKSITHDSAYKSFIFYCNNEPIGYCVVQIVDEMTFLKINFDVAKYVYPEQARNHMALIMNIGLQRVFLKKIRYFLKQVMEMVDLNCLFYKVYPMTELMDQHETTYTSLISEFIPVKPRIRIQCDDYVIPKVTENFALYHMNTRLSTVANVSVDAKIVLIGASDVALSFLENLIFNSSNHYVVFENLTLVSDRGIRFKYDLNDLEKHFLPITSHYSYEYMKSMSLNTWVNVVTGTVTAINRIDKHIIVDESHYVYYDYLFLFCGEQFICDYVCKDIDLTTTVSHDSESDNSANIVRPIKNLFVLNTEEDVLHASMSLKKLKNHTKDVVVYGKCLESLTVINTLLKSGIKGSRIVYIENKLDEKIPFVESEYIAKGVYEELVKNNVIIHKSCRFVEWKLNENDHQINKLTFKKSNKYIKFKCSGFFWFGQKRMSNITGYIMIRSSMKFDGHLVVSNSFQTNDEYVFAAGPVAKFNPNNREDGMLSHSYFNSVEVGSSAAKTFGALLGVFEEPSSIELIKPIFTYCHLPGDYQYLYCAIPEFKFYEEKTKTIKTGDKQTGYFEITLDLKGLVMSLSCYSKNNFHYLNLIHLCGKSISLFDSMLDRLENKTLPCLFEYFNEPWAQAIYSDKFDFLLEVLNMHWSNVKFKHVTKPLFEKIGKLMSKQNADTIAELAKVTKVEEEFKDKCLKLIQNVMLKFVVDNLDELPMYAHPITISKLLDEVNLDYFWRRVREEHSIVSCPTKCMT